MRVLILSATAGQGHHATAQAISAVMRERGDVVSILDVFAYISPALRDVIDKGYRFSTKLAPKVFGSVYGQLDKKTEPAGKISPTHVASQILMRELEGYIRNYNADVIISVHPFNSVILNTMVAKRVTGAITVGVITDFTVHPLWQDTGLLDYFVTVDRMLAPQMRKKGISTAKMLPIGIPVHPKFFRSVPKEEAREKLGLDPNKRTLLIMSGSMGFGRIDQSIKALDALETDFQALVVCGNNKGMLRTLKLLRLNKNFKIFGYVQNVDEMMDAADCIITKPGGLTVSETLAKNLPMILVNPIPGQESRNAEFLVNNQLAMLVSETYPLEDAVETLFEGNYHLEQILKNQRLFRKGDSAKQLAEFLSWEYQKREGILPCLEEESASFSKTAEE
ncbi:MAG: glycosyltransferase [Oscillospiraceae bacterium]|nr:glycosyltransferase [Oscillospiraceae bacterium]